MGMPSALSCRRTGVDSVERRAGVVAEPAGGASLSDRDRAVHGAFAATRCLAPCGGRLRRGWRHSSGQSYFRRLRAFLLITAPRIMKTTNRLAKKPAAARMPLTRTGLVCGSAMPNRLPTPIRVGLSLGTATR
jgi:hypothetical protein